MDKIIEQLEALRQEVGKEKDDMEKVIDACHILEKSWSRSTLAGHAKFFYKNFEEPDAYNRFSIEWGLIHGIPNGWLERSDEEVIEAVEKKSGQQLSAMRARATEIEQELTDLQHTVILWLSEQGMETARVENYSFKSATDIFNKIFPTRFMTRDSEAMTGHYVVPHIYYQAIAMYIRDLPEEVKGYIFEVKRSLKTTDPRSISNGSASFYVDNATILHLSEINSETFDLTKLIKLCKELNDNYSLENYLACGMILRSILDHIPPIFGKRSFDEVSSNFGSQSFGYSDFPVGRNAL